MTPLTERLTELAVAIGGCDWELPVDARETCEDARMEIVTLTRTLQWVHRNIARIDDWKVSTGVSDVVNHIQNEIAGVVDVDDDGIVIRKPK